LKELATKTPSFVSSLRMLTEPRSRSKTKAQHFYDRIADFHNLAMKLNGYRPSLAKYLKSLELEITPESVVLDAGCGTGLATLALYSAGYRPKKTIAFDLSFNSLTVAREQFAEDKKVRNSEVNELQGNLLAIPLADNSVDFIITCGALEYVPIETGIQEISRVLKPNGELIFIPVRRSPISAVLEIIYDFKTHKTREVRRALQTNFRLVSNHKFPITEPISWSKISFHLQKK
jgi:ubiquinone/menaquinone biosynthesis C-methylase UbiE